MDLSYAVKPAYVTDDVIMAFKTLIRKSDVINDKKASV